MKAFFRDVLNITYTSNTFSATKHEALVSGLLVKHGFTEVSKKESQQRVGKKVRLTEEVYLQCLSEGEFVPQPFGSQQQPDFMVKHKGELVKLECKSSKKNAFPAYNTTAPSPNTVYIFTSQKHGTTFFFGKDVLSPEMRESYAQLEAELWQVVERYKQSELWKNNERGFSYYMRNMFIQAGGADKVSYFTQPRRSECEEKVLSAF